MERWLYVDGGCGISGDMLVAALLDLGADRSKLDAALKPLEPEGLTYTVSRQVKQGFAGHDFDVHLAHHHAHAETAGHSGHHGRNLADVMQILEQLPISPGARRLAERTFRIVAEAEAKAHGRPIDEIHFHEVGALDSLADIVGAAVLVDDLQPAACVVTGFAEGQGTVTCAHGVLPVPVPAVLNIAQAYGIALRPSAVLGERVTPTGMALAAALRTQAALPQAYRIERVGVGFGKRDFGCPNFLRLQWISPEGGGGRLHCLEANLDDCSGEMLAVAADRLRQLGARDVCFAPCFMKKGRPAYQLQALVDEPLLERAAEVLFRETTTIGVRYYPVERFCMAREMVLLETPMGQIQAKRCTFGACVRCYPESDSVRAAAEARGLPYPVVFEQAMKAAQAYVAP